MKKLLAILTVSAAALGVANASGPIPDYQWNFDMTNSSAATNFIVPTTSAGVTGSPATSQGVLEMFDVNNNPTNLLGLVGTGVSGGAAPFDRAITLNGSMGGNGPLVYTPDVARSITNLGIVTNFTITAWVKADEAINGFPRIFMLAAQNVDGAGGGPNDIAFLFYVGTGGNNLQLKIHNDGGNGIFTSTSPLAAGATNWIFVAVTYDSTLDPTITSNVWFYVGDRVNSLGSQPNSVIGAVYGVGVGPSGASATVNSVPPANPNSPGYLNFSSALNGDGTTFGVSNVFVSIGNRPNRQRSFHGRYDDVRFYANRVLTLSELEQVRLDAHPVQPVPLTITQQPQNTAVTEGQGAAFTVVHTEAPNASYQWYRISPGSSVSNAIAGATNRDYVTPPLTIASDNGASYAVRIHSSDPIADNGGAGAYSTYALTTVVAANQLTVTPGMLKFEYYANNPGQSVDTFLASPPANYPVGPNLTLYPTSLDSRTVSPDDSHFGYFARITGSLTPTLSTNYVFYIRAADEAQMYLSTDGGASSNLICLDNQTGPQVFTGPESSVSLPGGYFSSPQALTAGTSYPIYVYLKSGAGPNFVQVAWKTDSGAQDLPANDSEIADRLRPISGTVLSTVALPSGTVSISSQPNTSTPSVAAHSRVTFNIGVSSSLSTNNATTTNGPVVVQWQKNGSNVSGALGTNYTTPYLSPADNNAQYSAVVSIPGASITSAPVSITVTSDNVAPTVISATPDDSMTSVTVKFSEPLDATTALNPANYQINGGALAVTGVTWANNSNTNLVGNPTFDSVKLSTALQADNTAYAVRVTGVKDTALNTITSNNSASFRSDGLQPGFCRFEYYEAQTYNSIVGLGINGVMTSSPKFTNSDPDTIVYPTSMEMSPDGTPTIRSASGGNQFIFPPLYATRMSAIFVPPVTTNYVFYIAANDSGILWLSTDANPANKRAIAYQDTPAGKRTWTGQTANNSTATFPTNGVGTSITVPGAMPWPSADQNGFAVITLTAGQRYYLELDHYESAGFDSADAVTYVMAADNASVTPPDNGSAPSLAGSVIGWYFAQPQVTSFAFSGGNVQISWSGPSSIDTGALGYPGLGNITASFPSAAALQTTPALVPASWTTLTNTSPATIPATNAAQFFRIAE